MMTWEQAFVLLQVLDLSRDYPNLRGLHNRALADLEAIDANSIGFASQVDQDEPLEDE